MASDPVVFDKLTITDQNKNNEDLSCSDYVGILLAAIGVFCLVILWIIFMPDVIGIIPTGIVVLILYIVLAFKTRTY